MMDLVGQPGLELCCSTKDCPSPITWATYPADASSAYTALETMDEKLTAQIALGVKTRAVDVDDMVHRIITRHLLPDIQGSLKSFTGQQLRCPKCGTKYRRIPLKGKCYCGHKLTLTVHEAA